MGGQLLPGARGLVPEVAEQVLTRQGSQRWEWIEYYERHGKNVSLTVRHHGIHRQTFYAWLRRYQVEGQGVLEDRSRAPQHVRQPQITREEEVRIIALRKKHLRYGKEKLAVIYERLYGEKISAWKVYRVIHRHDLYWHPRRTEKLHRRRRLGQRKKRITELQKRGIEQALMQLDTKAVWFPWCKRYIFTAVEKRLKLGFARMYKSCGSLSGRDFLFRLYLLVNKQLAYSHTDWGSEFGKYFLLTEWLIEYNCNRPHETLGYLTPIEYISQPRAGKVLPMSPTGART